jgi:hypothetical protein
MNSTFIEVAVAKFFGYRQNLIVPNVSWGFHFKHELDLMVVSGNGYATEVEIKISNGDLKRDKDKRHQHESNKIKNFYFAVPEKMRDFALANIPVHAGLITVTEIAEVTKVRYPKPNKSAVKLTDSEMNLLRDLGCMRIWSLKEKLIQALDKRYMRKE